MVTWVLYSSQMQKINEEQKTKIRKIERALKVAEVCECIDFVVHVVQYAWWDFDGSLCFPPNILV